jgi:hypothetical protein
MPKKRGVKYNSKSVLTLKSYTPEEIQKFLNSFLKWKNLCRGIY